LNLQAIGPENVSQIRLLRSIPMDYRRITSLLFSPDSQYLLADFNVQGRAANQFISIQVNDGAYNSHEGIYPSFSVDGKYIAASGTISRFENGQPAEKIKTLEGIKSPMSFSPDGELVAGSMAAGWLAGIRVYRMSDWSEIRSFTPKIGDRRISPDWATYVVWGESTLAIHSLQDDSLLASGDYATRSIAYSQDGKFLGLNDYYGMIYVYDLSDARNPLLMSIQNEARCYQRDGLVFSPANDLLALVCEENGVGIVKVWSFPDAQLLTAIPIGKGGMSLNFSPDGKMLAIGMLTSFHPDPEVNEIWLMGVP
jgi:WD40 repeat protein